ncbi:TetR/AcrR family transcriptional regulator [Levilactobacillus andaensis]|uniref:TetR/AcrR family transcriptional regulator n=1 Tax=Levilactobacillus andaensis TaxID=2799570 RepID=UPI001940F431|nr:TetR/AcrR family transcriptional regulator [Levilactobacillus andaensis]
MTAEEKIISTFLELIRTENYSKISIAQIMKKSGLTRTYFYQLFDSKCELARRSLFSIINELMDPLSHALINNESIDHQRILEALDFVENHKPAMLTLVFYQGPDFNFQGEIQRWIKKEITEQVKRKSQCDQSNDDFFAEMFSSSVVKMIDWYLHQDSVTVDQMSTLVERSLSQGLTSVI